MISGCADTNSLTIFALRYSQVPNEEHFLALPLVEEYVLALNVPVNELCPAVLVLEMHERMDDFDEVLDRRGELEASLPDLALQGAPVA